MNEFAPKTNININESENEEDKKGLENQKINLSLLAKEISKCEPDSLEFFKLKNSFIKAAPIYREDIQKYIEFIKDSDFSFMMDSGQAEYFKLADKLDLMEKEDKEMFYELFRQGQWELSSQIVDNILKKREFYQNKNKVEKEGEKKDVKDEVKESKEELPEFILKKFGFSETEVENLIQSWLTVQDDSGLSHWYISQSLQNINSLENFENNSVKYLFQNFGIRGFGRYHIRELKKQYKERENTGPYGIFVQGVMDWNGSFINSNQSEDLDEKIEEHGFLMRIIEADGKIGLAKRLLFLRDKYKQKIKFMYIHAHGNTDVIGLGDKKGSNRLFQQKDLEGKGVQKIRDLFEDDAEVILSSCLSGVKGGLAEEMANTYGVKVIAADKPTVCQPISIDIEKTEDGNNLKFDIIFNTQDMEGEENGENERKSDLLGTVTYNPKDK